MSVRAGFTLIELLVVIAILTIVAGVAGVSIVGARTPTPPTLERDLLALRREAIRRNTAITRTLHQGDSTYVVTALADGRMLADSTLRLNPATGALLDATR